MYDVIIIGAGPSGISCALYAARSGLKVTVVYKDGGALEKAHKIDNYFGFPQGVSGPELFRRGLEQAEGLGVTLVQGEVTALNYGDGGGFEVATVTGRYASRAIVLAGGSSRLTPDIEGIRAFEGKGVSYCAVCDGFFFRNREVAVIGNGAYALEEAEVLSRIATKVTLCTNGLPAPDTDKPTLSSKIVSVQGGERVSGLTFADGSHHAVDGVFVALGTAGSSALALKLGALTENGIVVTDELMRTNIPAVYAVGDCAGGLLQISKAVRDGAVAGLDLVKLLKSK